MESMELHEAREAIRNALKALEIHEEPSITDLGMDRYVVAIKGETFGIYDTKRNTFVD